MAAVETKHTLPAKYHKTKNNKTNAQIYLPAHSFNSRTRLPHTGHRRLRLVLARHNHNRAVSPSLAAISRQDTVLNLKSIVLIEPKIHNKIPKLTNQDTRLIVNSAINNLIILILKSNKGKLPTRLIDD